MEQKIRTMLLLQDSMNSKVHQQWRSQNFEWFRAVWVESAELLDHYGWKWWKHQSPDIQQVQLELIDIWHFGMSMLLLESEDMDSITSQVVVGLGTDLDVEAKAGNFIEDLESFVATVLTTKRFDLEGFSRLMRGVDLDFNQLYVGYVGKNVLNFFRQDNGYKDGSYRKLWAGREDNEHLAEIVTQLDADSSQFQQNLYSALAERYADTAGTC